MRLLLIVGLILLVLGVVSLGYQGITFVTRDRVADVGPVHIDADRPHTIWLHPAVGAAAVGIGLVLMLVGWRQGRSA